jgi:ABC-2 type transport system permease protein
MTTQSKSTISQDLILAARQGLLPVSEGDWLGGFGNMLGKELGQWWGTRTWWVQTLIWVLILNGVSTIVALTEAFTPGEKLQEVVQTFLPMAVGLVGIGVIIAAQGAIVGEKELGTAAWVMSKPASRSAFILAKIIAHAIGFSITAIIIPSAIFYIEMQLLIPSPLPFVPFLAGVGLALLSMLFYLVLTLMLGTLFNSRGPIAGIGIAMILTGLLLRSLIPLNILIFTPWLLPDLSGAIALGMPLPPVWFVPIVALSCWIILMTAVALWRFGREEF